MSNLLLPSCRLSGRFLVCFILAIVLPPVSWAKAEPTAEESAAGQVLPIAEGPAVDLQFLDPATSSVPQAAPTPTPSVTPTPGKPIMALLDWESNTLDQGQERALSQALWTRLHILGPVRLLPREATRNWLIRNDIYPSLPYHPGVPMGQVIRALNVDYLMTGHVERVGDAYHLDWTIYGGPKGNPLDETSNLAVSTPEQLLESMGGVAENIAATLGRLTGEDASAAASQAAPVPHKRSEASAKTTIVKAQALADVSPKKAESAEPENLAKPDEPAESPVSVKAGDKAPESSDSAALPPPPTLGATPVPEATPEPAKEKLGKTKSRAAKPESEKKTTGEQTHAEEPVPPAATLTPMATATPAPPAADGAQKADQLYRDAMASGLKSDERIAKLKEAVGLAPDNVSYRQRLAADYYRLGQFTEAITQCQEALKRDPKNSILMTIKGSAHFELKQYQDARTANEAAIAADPKNNFARFNLALTLTRQGSPKAAPAWREFLDLAASDPMQTQQIEEAKRNLAALESAAPKP